MTVEEKEWIEAYCPEMEATVLACMLNDADHFTFVKDILNVDDFHESRNRRLFRDILDTHEQKGSIDVPLLLAYVKDQRNIPHEEYEYVLNLQSMGQTYVNITAYCQDLRQFTIKRNITNLLRQGITDLKDGIEPSKSLERIIETAQKIKESKPNANSIFRHLLATTTEGDIVEEIKNTSPGVRIGLRLGNVDLKLPGGALTIVAGPTGHGKTLVLINLILNYLEIYPDKKAFFFSYEESRAAVLSLFLNTYINENLSENNRESIKSYFRDGQPTYIFEKCRSLFLEKKNQFFEALILPGRLNVFYSDYCAEELVQASKFLKDNSNVGLVAVDYMQLLNSMEKKSTQRQEELKRVCLMLKNCAVSTGLPIALAAQFNRQVVNEATISPVQIGEAGDIERAANMILGLWNRNYEGFTDSGNLGKNGKKIPKESAIYLEMLKSRENGIGHAGVFDLRGNTGKITARNAVTTDIFG